MNRINSFLPLRTNRLIIRPIALGDQQDYFEIFGDSFISRYDDYQPISFDEAKTNIDDIIAGYASESLEQEYAVEELSSGKMIGVLYIHVEEATVSIGYHFNKEWHGHGVAIKALKSWIPLLVSCFNKQVRALVHPGNEPSKRLLAKLGFSLFTFRILPDTGTPEEEYRLED